MTAEIDLGHGYALEVSDPDDKSAKLAASYLRAVIDEHHEEWEREAWIAAVDHMLYGEAKLP